MKKRINIVRISIAGLIGIFTVIIFNIKEIDKISYADFIPVIAVLLVFGSKEVQLYLDYKKRIRKGIDLLRNNLIWSIDNLIIQLDSENSSQIIIRNDLLWIEREKKQNENADKLLEILISDFKNIAEDRQFKKLLKDKTVKFDLYSSDLRNEELLKTEIINNGSRQCI